MNRSLSNRKTLPVFVLVVSILFPFASRTQAVDIRGTNGTNNRVRLNTFYGNGPATSKDSPSATNSNNYGLGLFGASQNNLIEKNKFGGNINGLYLGAELAPDLPTGNIIRCNVILGNPPVQVSNDYWQGYRCRYTRHVGAKLEYL